MTITSFSGSYDFLSNFYPCTIEWQFDVYPSAEHAFQASKTLSKTERRMIASQSTPGKAKRAGRRVELRPNWDEIKLQVMEDILRIKFRNPKLRQKLLSTGNQMLIEGNHWNDTFWGCVPDRKESSGWRGQNNLGKILMRIRRDFAEK